MCFDCLLQSCMQKQMKCSARLARAQTHIHRRLSVLARQTSRAVVVHLSISIASQRGFDETSPPRKKKCAPTATAQVCDTTLADATPQSLNTTQRVSSRTPRDLSRPRCLGAAQTAAAAAGRAAQRRICARATLAAEPLQRRGAAGEETERARRSSSSSSSRRSRARARRDRRASGHHKHKK
jgi:hypothetical protein